MNPKFFRNGIVMLVLVVGTAALLFTWITASSTPVTTGYSKFLGDVAAGQVKEVVQQGTNLTVKKAGGTSETCHQPRSAPLSHVNLIAWRRQVAAVSPINPIKSRRFVSLLVKMRRAEAVPALPN